MSLDQNYLKRILDQKKKEFFKGDEKRYYKIPNDTTPVTLRILPPHPLMKDQNIPGAFIRQHYKIPHKDVKVFPCYRTWGLECGLCAELQKWSTRGVPTDLWESSDSAVMNALVIDDKTQNPPINPKQPYIFQGRTNDLTWLIGQMIDPQIGNLTDIKTGSNVIFAREKAGGKLTRTFARMSTPIAPTDAEMQLILSQMYNFDSLYRLPDDERHKKYLEGIESLKFALETRAMQVTQPNGGYQPPQQQPLADIPFAPTPVQQPQQGYNPAVAPANYGAQPSNVAGAPPTYHQPQATSARPAGIPADAPECFGNKTVGLMDSKGEPLHVYDPNHKKCVMCYKSFDCENAIKAKG